MSILDPVLTRSGGELFARTLREVIRLVLLVATLCVIWWYAAAIQTIDSVTPPRIAMSQLSLTVPPGGTVQIGRRDLGQAPGTRSAAEQHFSISHDANSDTLTLRKTTDLKRMDLKFNPTERSVYSDRYPIPPHGQGTAEVVLGTQTIALTRTDDDDVLAQIGSGSDMREVKISSHGLVEVAGEVLRDWCGPEGGWAWVQRRFVLPVKRLSGSISESRFIPNKLRESNARRVAQFSTAPDCQLDNGVALVQLLGLDDELELGLRRFFDDGKVRYYVHPVTVPPNVPISYRTILPGGSADDAIGEQMDHASLVWHLAGGTTPPHPSVTGFTAGFTRYTIDANPSVDTNTPGWVVNIAPTSRIAHFDLMACDGKIGVWPEKEMQADLKKEILRCPGPSLEENVNFKYQHRSLGSTIERLFAYGRINFVVAVGDAEIAGGALNTGELVLYLVLSMGCMVLLFVRRPSAERRAWWRYGTRQLTRLVALGCVGYSVWVLMASTWNVNDTPTYLLWSSIVLMGAASVAAWIDKDTGWLQQLLTLVIFSLMLIGAVTLFSLSAQGDNSDWERYFIKHKAFLLDFLPAFWIVVCLGSSRTQRTALGRSILDNERWCSLFNLLPLGLLFVFLCWLIIGTQEGLLGFQPVEFGKFMVVLGLGAVLARWVLKARLSGGVTARGKTIGFTIILFMVALVVVPTLKSDISPIIVVAGSLFVISCIELMATALRIRRERKRDQADIDDLPTWPLPMRSAGMGMRHKLTPLYSITFLVGIVCFVIFAVDRTIEPEGFSFMDCPTKQVKAAEDALGEGRRTITERFMSWADMRLQRDVLDANCRPNSGGTIELRDRGLVHQGMRSRAAIAHADCGVSDEFYVGPLPHLRKALGLPLLSEQGICGLQNAKLPTPNCSERTLVAPVAPHCIPVVESDFIGAYLLAKHGLGAGLILVIAQYAFIMVGLIIYARLKLASVDEPIVRAAQDILATAALGATALFAIQWTLAWGNTFVLLPIMGQPMTWVSAATSHHLFMALPACLALLVAARVSQLSVRTIPFGDHP